MIVGTGLDVVEIARIERALARRGERFAARLLVPDELAALAAAGRPAGVLAQRFAAKEAVLKALGTGLAEGIGWLDVVTRPGAAGWSVELRGRAAEVARERAAGGAVTAHLSVARSRSHAVASAILESA